MGQILVVQRPRNLVYKDPDEVRDYPVDWTPDLPAGATITDSVFLPPAGITVDWSGIDTPFTYVRLAGGTVNRRYRVVNRVTLSTGEVYDCGFDVVCKER